MRTPFTDRMLRRSGAWLRQLLRDRRGEGDLMTSLLLTAAGAVMVGITVPSLFDSSDAAARTFKGQVDVLEKGASPSGGGGGTGSGSGWDISIGTNGVSVSGNSGGIRGNVSFGGGNKPSVTVGASGGSGGSGSGGSGSFPSPGGGASLTQGGGNLGGSGASLGGGNGALAAGAGGGAQSANQALQGAILNAQ